MLHLKRYAHEDSITEEEVEVRKAVQRHDRLAMTAEEQIQAVHGHPVLRNEALNRKERRLIKNRLDAARGRGFTKSNKEGRNKRRCQ